MDLDWIGRGGEAGGGGLDVEGSGDCFDGRGFADLWVVGSF